MFTKNRVGVVLFLCCLAGSLTAQISGRLTGSVVDPSGAVVPGAKVEVLLPGGGRAILSAETTSDGLFSLTGVPAGTYDVIFEAQGFRKRTERGIVMTPGKDTVLDAVRLEVGTVAEVVEVTTRAEGVQTSNAEVSLNFTRTQLQGLPVLNRGPQAFVTTQAGVNLSRDTPTINGQRTTFTNVTLDGINIQDNFIRTNAVTFSPFVLLADQVAEFTIQTSNASSAQGGGASQVIFVTPSGTNQYHGSVFWQNRNNAVAANTWFNNQARVKQPFLNQNQAGGSLGGPILKDKLLFYVNYEAFRVRQQTSANRTILTGDARQGLFTYRDTSGAVRKVNLLQAAGVTADPATQALIGKVPGQDKINNFDAGDSSAALLRNTAGYRFNIRNNRQQDHITGKVDYNLSTKHTFSGTYTWTTDIIDRPDVSNDYSPFPKVINDDISELFSVGWRWNPTPSITNELRGGRSNPPVIFSSAEDFGNHILAPAGGLFGNPLNTFRTQGRNPKTYNLMDNASYVRGKHTFQFGFQSQAILVQPFNEAGITPTYTLGIGTGNTGLTNAQLPGASSTDITAANNLLANLAGYVTSYSQTFNAADRTSGFVKGARNDRHYRVDNYSGYLTDTWRAWPGLTVNLGVRYEYFTRVNERDGLALLPRLPDGNPLTALASNSTLDFAGAAVDRPFYGSDRNNFAPNVGLAWDPFGGGKTSIRAAYSLNFVNDEFVVALANVVGTNQGLGQTVAVTGSLSGRVSTGLPAITTPTFAVPRTFADNYLLSATTNFSVPDPNLRTPYVQQWNIGIQQEYRGVVFDLRYVGNHGTKLFRQVDHNQVIVRENGFLTDFLKAKNNGDLARASSGVFNPNFNASIPGSQPLTFFPNLPSGGQLNSSTIRTLIDEGRVGELAFNYQSTRRNGSINFFPNANAAATNLTTNYSNSTYNSLQFDVRSRPMRGLTFQANYNFSKVMSDARAGSQNAFQARNEAFLDRNNPKLERARAPFDLTHAIKGNFVYQLPAGPGHRFNVAHLGRVLGGWQIGGIFTKQSGTPISVLSGRGTLNRNGQSARNTVNTNLTKSQLDQIFQLRMTGNGPYVVAASAIGPDGRAVAADGAAPFNGQVFFQPGAGTLGGLQRSMFSGPWVWTFDFALIKTTKIRERHSIVLRMDASNLFNHPAWSINDYTVTSTTFGKITGNFYGRRVLQFNLQYKF